MFLCTVCSYNEEYTKIFWTRLKKELVVLDIPKKTSAYEQNETMEQQILQRLAEKERDKSLSMILKQQSKKN